MCRMLVAALLFAGTASAAEVYRWKDENGVTHYGDRNAATDQAEPIEVRDRSAGLGGHVVPASSVSEPQTASPAFVAPDILMYDNPACGYCRKAKRWFNANGLRFRTIDITASKSNHDQFIRDGGRGTPLIFVDGVAVRGFNEQRLQQLVFGR